MPDLGVCGLAGALYESDRGPAVVEVCQVQVADRLADAARSDPRPSTVIAADQALPSLPSRYFTAFAATDPSYQVCASQVSSPRANAWTHGPPTSPAGGLAS